MKERKPIERGDIYLFYRNKVDVEKASGKDDVQRLYLVLAADDSDKVRLFVVGRKQMPEIIEGKSKSTEREWMMNYSTAKPEKIGEELRPIAYETKTRGERQEPEAIPCAEGRYVIFERHNSTQLAYKMEKPEKPGKVQKELSILPEASYVISVRNPEVKVTGFPDKKPDYPKSLVKKFSEERWLDVIDPKLLDYPNAQFLLVGAHKDLSELEVKVTGKPHLFKTLGLKKGQLPMEALEEGQFATPQYKLEIKEPKGDRSKGGKKAANRMADIQMP